LQKIQITITDLDLDLYNPYLAMILSLLVSLLLFTVCAPTQADSQMINQPTNDSVVKPNEDKTLQPWYGVSRIDVTTGIAKAIGLNEPKGLLVTDVIPGSPAEKAGLRGGYTFSDIDGKKTKLGGDVILKVDNKTVTELNDLSSYIKKEKKVGDLIRLAVFRDGQIKEFNVTLTTKPNFFPYRNSTSGISIQYPSDWNKVEDGKNIRFYSPVENISHSSHENVFISVTPSENSTLDETVRDVINFGKQNYSNFKLIKSDTNPGVNTTLAGNAAELVYQYRDREQNDFVVRHLLVFMNNKLYMFYFLADLAKYSSYLPTLENIIHSIHISDLDDNSSHGEAISSLDIKTVNASADNNIADYTLMVYMVGSDMESATTEDILEMKSVGSNSNVNMLLETGGGDPQSKHNNKTMIDFKQIKRHKILNNGIQTIGNLGLQNMGDPRTLSNFIIWGMSEFPAKKYAIILWDHGSGINGFGGDLLFENDRLTLDEIRKAFQDARNVTNKKFELIGFDACLMASVEVADKVNAFGNYMVSSEEIEPSWGWDYSTILANLTKYPKQNGSSIGKTIANTFVSHSKTIAASQRFDAQKDVTLSVINLTRVSKLKQDLSILSDYLIGRIIDLPAALSLANIVDLTERYGPSTRVSPNAQGSSGMVDLYDLTSNILDKFPETAHVVNAIQNSLNSSVIYNVNGEAKPNANGLSVYMPLQKEEFTESGIINSLAAWQKIVKLQQTLIKSDKEPPIVESHLDDDGNTIKGRLYSDDVSRIKLVIYASLPEGNRIFHQELDPSSFIKSDRSFEYKWNNQILSLCNDQICRPASMDLEANRDRKFALIPVRLESYADNGNRIVSLNYEVNKEGGYNFLGATREIKEEGAVPKEKLPLLPKDKVHTLVSSFDWNDVKSDYDINFVNYDPIEVRENFGPRYVTYNGTFTVKFEVCDYSDKCWSTRDFHFDRTSKIEPVKSVSNATAICKENTSLNTSGNFSTYENPLYGFRIQYPSNWEKIEQGIPDPGVVQFVLLPEGTSDRRAIIASILTNYHSDPRSLKQSIDNYIKVIKEFNPLDKLIVSNATVLGGMPAHKVVHITQGQPKTQAVHIRTIVGDKEYYMDLSTSPSNFRKYSTILEKMINSFEFCTTKGKVVHTGQNHNNSRLPQLQINSKSNNKTSQDIIRVSNFSTYENPLYGFRIQYPSNWITDVNSNSTVFIKSPYERKRGVGIGGLDNFSEQLGIFLNPWFITTKSSPGVSANEIIELSKKTRIGFNLIERNQTTLEGNFAYKLIWIDFDPELRIQLKHMAIITIIGNNTYYIEYTAESSNYELYLPIINKMVSSLYLT
jgi:hypothetical protein